MSRTSCWLTAFQTHWCFPLAHVQHSLSSDGCLAPGQKSHRTLPCVLEYKVPGVETCDGTCLHGREHVVIMDNLPHVHYDWNSFPEECLVTDLVLRVFPHSFCDVTWSDIVEKDIQKTVLSCTGHCQTSHPVSLPL